MTYKDYIDLGFKRIDITDSVVFNETGYHGYILSYKITKSVHIEACFQSLDKPELYIKKSEGKYAITEVNLELIKELIK